MKAAFWATFWLLALVLLGLPLIVLFAVTLFTSRVAEAILDHLISRVDRSEYERKRQKIIDDLLKESCR